MTARRHRPIERSRKEADTRTAMAITPSTAHLAAPSGSGSGDGGWDWYPRGRRTGSESCLPAGLPSAGGQGTNDET